MTIKAQTPARSVHRADEQEECSRCTDLLKRIAELETALGYRRADERADILNLFGYWQRRCKKPNAKLTPERRQKLRARLHQGYTPADIMRAIDGAATNPPRRRDEGVTYDDLVSICRNGAQLERYIERAPAQTDSLEEKLLAGEPVEVARWERPECPSCRSREAEQLSNGILRCRSCHARWKP